MSDWISVKDQMPDDFEIVACLGTFLNQVPYIALYEPRTKRFLSPDDIGLCLTNITHWLRLPKLPEDQQWKL